MNLIVPAAGHSTRFKEAGYTQPKYLLDFDKDRNVLSRILDSVPDSVNKLVAVSEKDYGLIEDDIKNKCKIHKIESHSYGPVFTLSESRDLIGDDEILISYCDFVSHFDYEKFIKFKNENNYDAIIFCYTGFHPNLLTQENPAFVRSVEDLVSAIQEKKPFTENKEEELASDGFYYFKSKEILLKAVDACLSDEKYKIKNEYYVTAPLQYLIQEGYRVGFFSIDRTSTLGTPLFYKEYLKWSKLNLENKNKIKLKDPLYITAAGEGSRFNNSERPKPFLLLNNKTFLEQSVCKFECEGKLILGLRKEQERFDKIKHDEVVYFNETTRGPSETLKKMIDKTKLPEDKGFFVNGCDYIVDFKEENLEMALSFEPDVIMSVSDKNFFSEISPLSFSWVRPRHFGMKADAPEVFIKEYPFEEESPYENFMYTGFTWFKNRKIFLKGYDRLENSDTEIYVENVIKELIRLKARVLVLYSKYYGFGSPKELNCFNFWLDFFKYEGASNRKPN